MTFESEESAEELDVLLEKVRGLRVRNFFPPLSPPFSSPLLIPPCYPALLRQSSAVQITCRSIHLRLYGSVMTLF